MSSLLELKSIHKSFGDKEVLKGVDLSVQEGQVVVILGPSGCGKSTLLRCINGLESINLGQMIFNDHVYGDKNTNWQQIRQQIGMVFQSYDLFPHMTVMENLLLAPTKVQKRKKEEVIEVAKELLARVGLDDRTGAYPHELSGGQKQRIAIVRALCMNPKLMLFDEVTASIDPEMVYEVLQVIKELKETGLASKASSSSKHPMTMIIVTHEMGFAKNVADTVVFMENGHVLEVAKPEEFFSAPKEERTKQFLEKFLHV